MKQYCILSSSIIAIILFATNSRAGDFLEKIEHPDRINVQQNILPPNTFDPSPSNQAPPAATPPPAVTVPPTISFPGTAAPSSTAPAAPNTLAVPPPDAILKFSGQGPYNSRPFTIGDRWEVDWDSPGPLTVTLGHLDGKPDELIGRQAGPSHGSSFQPTGGQYYLKIEGTGNWVVWMVQVGAGTSPAVSSIAPPISGNQGILASAPAAPPGLPTAPTNYGDTSYYQNPIVIIRGANGSGTGFLVKMGQSTCVITNQHVISDNPNLSIVTIRGQSLIGTAVQGATDRDLAMITVKDDGSLPTIPFATDVANAAHPDDDTVIPGNSQGGGVVVDTPGKVVGIGPIRLEVSNPIYPGNSGSPVVDLRTKQAVGVITEAEKSDNDGWLNQGSLANHNSGIKAIRYFSLRFDNVPKWEPFDMRNFYTQTHFIEKFHQQSLELVSFFNALKVGGDQASQQQTYQQQQQQYQQQEQQYQQQQQQYQYNPGFGRPAPPQPPQPPAEEPAPEISPTLYRNNSKLSDIMDQFNDSVRDTSSDADIESKLQVMFMNLNGIAQTDTAFMSNPALFYSFNRTRTEDEMELRNQIIGAFKDLSQKAARHN